MNPHIESAIREWLVAEGLTDQIVCGFDGEKISSSATAIICAADDAEHVVGPLEKVTCHLIITTPEHGGTIAAHKAVCKTLYDMIQDADLSALSQKIADSGCGKGFAGAAPLGESSATERGRWNTDLAFIIGLKEAS